VWMSIADAAKQLGLRAALVGAKNSRTKLSGDLGPNVIATGYLPLSKVLLHADVAIHHGGVGTTFSVAGAGIPAVVVPQAFDQQFTAGLVEEAGIGMNAARTPILEALRLARDSESMRERAQKVREQLVETEAATLATVARILEPR
jgi:UDP:flavonoid glycosyltransferase YjiC (YdhE family)